MLKTVFFSWQIDTPPREGRNFIETALERAVARISDDTAIEEAERELEVDRDTKNVPGSPPIVDTILRKIDQAAVFVPDFTFIGKRPDGRPTPNPNVLIEYGWALKVLTHARIVPVMNTAFGEPGDSMPFDLRHLRNPITYFCPPNLDSTARHKIRDELAKRFETAIRLVLDSRELQDSLAKPSTPTPFDERKPADGRGRFKGLKEPIGLIDTGGLRGEPRYLFLSSHPVTWFRMMPSSDPGRAWSVSEIQQAMNNPFLQPLSEGWRGYDFVRTHEGFGVYACLPGHREQSRALVFGFINGEIWSVDTYWLEAYKNDKDQLTVPSEEACVRRALVSYAKVLEKLGIHPPFRWIAGMENLMGRLLYVPAPPKRIRLRIAPDGKCMTDVVSASGVYSPGDDPGRTLAPFFAKLYDSCGVMRPSWLDE